LSVLLGDIWSFLICRLEARLLLIRFIARLLLIRFKARLLLIHRLRDRTLLILRLEARFFQIRLLGINIRFFLIYLLDTRLILIRRRMQRWLLFILIRCRLQCWLLFILNNFYFIKTLLHLDRCFILQIDKSFISCIDNWRLINLFTWAGGILLIAFVALVIL